MEKNILKKNLCSLWRIHCFEFIYTFLQIMYVVAGANLFSQWQTENLLIEEFTKNLKYGDPTNYSLQDIKWSYNILKTKKGFYIAGSLNESCSSNITEIILPDDAKNIVPSNLTMVGNDYSLILVDKKKLLIWVIDLENNNKVKKLNCGLEVPIDKSSKKMRVEDEIVKAVATNHNLLLLTSRGLVYCGFLPTLLDSNNCTGKVCDVQCGFEHCVLLTDAGKVYTWGNGRRLQLGHGDLTNLELPTEVEALSGIKIVKICAGGWHTLALSEHGDLYAWGWNDMGQLGIKSNPDNSQGDKRKEFLKSYPVPIVVDLFDENGDELTINVKDMSCGSRHSAILLDDNSVWTSGNNKYGQLGCKNEDVLNCFRKTYQSTNGSSLMCGLWTTIIVEKD